MKIMKNIHIFTLLMIFSSVLQAKNLLEDSLEEFLNRIGKTEDEKQGFRNYYSNFLEVQNKIYKSSKRKKLIRLRATALTTLKEKNPEWYKIIEAYSLDLEESTQECRKVRLFLTRYALFDSYQKGEPVKIVGSREKVKHFLRPVKNAFVAVKNKVTGLFTRRS